MDIKVLRKTNDEIDILIKNCDLALINSIKRVCSQEVETLAIEEVDFYENSGVICMEMLAHRIALIPLTSHKRPLLGYEKKDILLTLEVKAEKDGQVVYSGELKSSDPDYVPVIQDIPIAKLNKNQEIHLVGHAQWSNGRDHYKWSPTCPVTFRTVKPVTAATEKMKDDYILSITSSGSLKPEEIFCDALQVLYNDLEKFIDKV